MHDTALQHKRLVAAAIDIGIGFALAIALGVGSLVLGFVLHFLTRGAYVDRVLHFGIALLMLAYLLGRDLLGGGRSLGKKSQDIRVVGAGGAPIGPVESVKRNAIFAVGSALAAFSAALQLVPCLGDAVACLLIPLVALGGLVSLAAAAVEMIKITQDPQGTRFGDQLAGTKVVF